MAADYYSLSDVQRDATQEEIKRAYWKKLIQVHPDRHNGDAYFENLFKQVSEAYAILNDPVKRRQYDNDLSYSEHQGSFTNPIDFPVIEYFEAQKRRFYPKRKTAARYKSEFVDYYFYRHSFSQCAVSFLSAIHQRICR